MLRTLLGLSWYRHLIAMKPAARLFSEHLIREALRIAALLPQ